MFSKQTESRVALMVAPGLEEIEGLTVADILYRSGIPCDTVAVADTRDVVSSHEIHLTCDLTLAEADLDSYDMLVLPGGMPGTKNLAACEPLMAKVDEFVRTGRQVAAICAAPALTLAARGLLEGRRATSNPNFQHVLAENGATVVDEPVVVDGNLTTSQGMGTAIDFALQIVRHFLGEGAVDATKEKIVYQG